MRFQTAIITARNKIYSTGASASTTTATRATGSAAPIPSAPTTSTGAGWLVGPHDLAGRNGDGLRARHRKHVSEPVLLQPAAQARVA
jgi:hypothetical protein